MGDRELTMMSSVASLIAQLPKGSVMGCPLVGSISPSVSPSLLLLSTRSYRLQLILVWACGKLALLIWLWDSLSGSSSSLSNVPKRQSRGGRGVCGSGIKIMYAYGGEKGLKPETRSTRHFPNKGLLAAPALLWGSASSRMLIASEAEVVRVSLNRRMIILCGHVDSVHSCRHYNHIQVSFEEAILL